MRVERIDLRYPDDDGDRLAGASLHVRSYTPAGQATYTPLALEPGEVRALDTVLRKALHRVTHRALTSV